jgi:spermidine/putrescine transport system ATP-binding protein
VVIMSRGHIAQIGSPKDIYRAPANRVVAEFVGRNNIISGTVAKASAKTVTIDGSLGSFTVDLGKHDKPQKGEVAQFVVAADLAQISTTKPRRGNAIACSLISEEFIGSVVTLFLEAEDGSELKVQLQERELSKMNLKTAATIYLSWTAEQAHYIGAN